MTNKPKVVEESIKKYRVQFDRERIKDAYAVLRRAYGNRKATKIDLCVAIDEAIGLLGEVLGD